MYNMSNMYNMYIFLDIFNICLCPPPVPIGPTSTPFWWVSKIFFRLSGHPKNTSGGAVELISMGITVEQYKYGYIIYIST